MKSAAFAGPETPAPRREPLIPVWGKIGPSSAVGWSRGGARQAVKSTLRPGGEVVGAVRPSLPLRVEMGMAETLAETLRREARRRVRTRPRR